MSDASAVTSGQISKDICVDQGPWMMRRSSIFLQAGKQHTREIIHILTTSRFNAWDDTQKWKMTERYLC